MPRTLNPTTTSPTLIPCQRCGAMSWAKPGQRDLACEGCGERLEAGEPRRARPSSSPVAGRSERASGRTGCRACGRPQRLGRPCLCGGGAPSAVAGPSLALPAERASLAAMAHQELAIPAALLVVGLSVGALAGVGGAGVLLSLGAGLAFTLVYVVLGLAAGYLIGGSLLGWELGPVGLSALQLAAVAAFDFGGSALLEATGFPLRLPLVIGGWLLMMHFFKLSFAQCFFYRLAISACAFFGYMSLLATLA